MKGATGVFIDNKNTEQSFLNFLNNASIEYIGSGSYGITFKAYIPDTSTYVSDYKYIDYEKYGQPVKSLLVKISSLGYPKFLTQDNFPIQPITKEDFVREVNIQTEIFLKTMNTLQPLCPGIVYSNTYEENQKTLFETIVNKFVSTNTNASDISQSKLNYTFFYQT